MRALIYFIILISIGFAVGTLIQQDPGYALFAYRDWSVEMPLWFAALAIIVSGVLLFWLYRSFTGICKLGARWRNFWQTRRKNKAQRLTNQGLIKLAEGHWHAAEKYLQKGANQGSELPLLNYLSAAKAAQEQGASARRDIYLHKALKLVKQQI